MKITSHNKTFEWRLRLVEWRYAQAALLGTALIQVNSRAWSVKTIRGHCQPHILINVENLINDEWRYHEYEMNAHCSTDNLNRIGTNTTS